MKKHYQKKSKIVQNIAKERITILFSEAKKRFKEDPALSKRYVHLARKLAMKAKVSIPRPLKRQFCKNCGVFWMPSKTVRVRTHTGHLVYHCLECKAIRRFVYKK